MKDSHDWNSDEMKALGPEGRGKLIMDQITPRAYSWMTNQDGLKYLHEHEAGEFPLEGLIPARRVWEDLAAQPGTFTVRAGASRHYNGPIADDSDD